MRSYRGYNHTSACGCVVWSGSRSIFRAEKKNNGAGGMGGKIQPSAVLVIQNGQTKLVNVKNQDGMTKILDMVPDIVSRFSKGKNDDLNLDDVKVDEAEDDKQD